MFVYSDKSRQTVKQSHFKISDRSASCQDFVKMNAIFFERNGSVSDESVVFVLFKIKSQLPLIRRPKQLEEKVEEHSSY